MESTEETVEPTETKELRGAFVTSLKRNNKKIRDDRATAIGENAELLYKREVEDLGVQLKQLVREQENMLDQSPHHADSLIFPSDFDAKEYVKKDLEKGLDIRNTKIKLDIATTRYNYLFGGL